MRTSKSPVAMLTVAYWVAWLTLPFYAHRFSPEEFIQPQLFACLMLKEFLQLDCREFARTLEDASDCRRAIHLERVPHFTTFQKAAKRLLRSALAKQLLSATIRLAQEDRLIGSRVRMAALDGTAFESHHASSYYVRRQEKGGERRQITTCSRFRKASIVCDTSSHLILAVVPGQGPGPDIKHFRAALDQSRDNIRIDALAADAG